MTDVIKTSLPVYSKHHFRSP